MVRSMCDKTLVGICILDAHMQLFQLQHGGGCWNSQASCCSKSNERSHELAIEQMKVAQEQAKFQSQMMVLMQVAIDRDRDLNNRDSTS